MKRILCVALALLTPVAAAAEAASPMGQWSRGDGKAKVKVAKCGANICATNTWIKPGTPSEKAGDVLVMEVKPDSPSTYSGTAFDPQRNMRYKIKLKVSENNMTTTGCILGGLLCKGVDWTKIR